MKGKYILALSIIAILSLTGCETEKDVARPQIEETVAKSEESKDDNKASEIVVEEKPDLNNYDSSLANADEETRLKALMEIAGVDYTEIESNQPQSEPGASSKPDNSQPAKQEQPVTKPTQPAPVENTPSTSVNSEGERVNEYGQAVGDVSAMPDWMQERMRRAQEENKDNSNKVANTDSSLGSVGDDIYEDVTWH